MNLKSAEKEANKLLKSLGISEVPIPVDSIAKRLGIELQYDTFDGELSGILYRDEDQTIIGVNSSHHINRQRFTIAHEIGHFLLHQGNDVHVDRGFKVNFRDSSSSLAINPEEIEANAFAASLLMPKELLVSAVLEKLENGIDLSSNESPEMEEIARKFKVSQQALYIRLGKLGYI